MARVRTVGIIPSHFHPRYRSAPGEIAARMFPDLATPNDLAIADWRRQAFNSDLVWADRVVRGDADVVDDEPRAQPRRRSSDAEIAYRLWGREQEREAREAAQEDVRQRWHDFYMESSIFQRKGR